MTSQEKLCDFSICRGGGRIELFTVPSAAAAAAKGRNRADMMARSMYLVLLTIIHDKISFRNRNDAGTMDDVVVNEGNSTNHTIPLKICFADEKTCGHRNLHCSIPTATVHGLLFNRNNKSCRTSKKHSFFASSIVSVIGVCERIHAAR